MLACILSKWYQSLNHKNYMLIIMIITSVVIMDDDGCKCINYEYRWCCRMQMTHDHVHGRVHGRVVFCLCIQRDTQPCTYVHGRVPSYTIPIRCILDNVSHMFGWLANSYNMQELYFIECFLIIHARNDHGLSLHLMVCNNN